MCSTQLGWEPLNKTCSGSILDQIYKIVSFCVLPFLGEGVEPFEGCGGWIGIDEFVSKIYYLKLIFFIHPPPELLPVLGPWEWWRATFTWRGPAV